MDWAELSHMGTLNRLGFPGDSVVKNSPAMQEPQEAQVRSLSWEDPLEEGVATHSSILAWRISWTEEPDGLQSICLKESQLKQLSTQLAHSLFLNYVYFLFTLF